MSTVVDVLSKKLEKYSDETPEVFMQNKFEAYINQLQTELIGYEVEDISEAMKDYMLGRLGYVAGYSAKYKMEDGSIEYVEFKVEFNQPTAWANSYSIFAVALKYEDDGTRTHQSEIAHCSCSYYVQTNEFSDDGKLDTFINKCNTVLQDIAKRGIMEVD